MTLSRHDKRHLKQVAAEARRWFAQNSSPVGKMVEERKPGHVLCHWIDPSDGVVKIYVTADDEMTVECYRDWHDPVKAALFREFDAIPRDMPDMGAGRIPRLKMPDE